MYIYDVCVCAHAHAYDAPHLSIHMCCNTRYALYMLYTLRTLHTLHTLARTQYTSVFLDMLGELHLSTSADDWTVEHTLHESNTSPGGKARVLLRHTGDPATAFFSYTSAIKAVAARKNACSPAASHAMQAVVRKHVAMARTRVPLVPSSPEAEATLKRLGVPTTTIAADAGAGAGASAAVPSPSSPSSLSPSFSASASASSGPCSSWEDIREALPLPSPPLLFDDVSDADIDSLLQYICACECK